jgi:hypothetical protein
MDTDSLYLAISAKTLPEVVKPHLRDVFFSEYDQWFPTQVCAEHKSQFITTQGNIITDCDSCKAKELFDKRTPGLFKLEYEGAGMISLCSKTYHCFGETNKTSTKGLSKYQNTLDKKDFLTVLNTQQTAGGTNIGFKLQDSSIYTYTQHRSSLTFLYVKRQVQADNTSTKPLLI